MSDSLQPHELQHARPPLGPYGSHWEMPPWPRLDCPQGWQWTGHMFPPAGKPHICALARRFRPLWPVAQQVKCCQCTGAAHGVQPSHRAGRAPGTGFLCFLFPGQRARSLRTLPGWVLSPSGGFGYCRGISGLVCFHPHYPSYPTSRSLLLHLTPVFLVREAAHCQ